MLAGAPPFYSRDKNVMFKNRMEKPIELKSWFSDAASSLLQGLLNNDVLFFPHNLGAQPDQRLGNNGA